ncbi:TetR/AcrR family transcriptional regulator [Patulibacter sp. S7RM1-6]
MHVPSARDPEAALAPPAWAALDGAAKRRRTLEVASVLFAREGVDFPMPALAEALGVGVGSIYRQVGKKDDIVAALVVERIEEARRRFLAAAELDDPWEALQGGLLATVRASCDDRLARDAWVLVPRPEVEAARQRARAVLYELFDRARAAGRVREDATAADLDMLLLAVQNVADEDNRAAVRITELVLAGLTA